jgi:5,10-methenyltetrahydrofolate synthetase
LDKQSIRTTMRKKRKNLSLAEKQRKDFLILEHLKEIVAFETHIGVFLSFQDEIDTFPIVEYLFEKGIKVSSSKIEENNLVFYQLSAPATIETGVYNIPIPQSDVKTRAQDMGILLIPLLAFSKEKHRVGYGKGYYDRYLKNYKGLKVGLAYDFQYLPCFKTDQYDIPLDMIVTESQIMK